MENHRILIVEDDEAIAGAVSRIIESWGLTPRCVRDFRDVLREFTDFDPHLVLMDITLPFLTATTGAAKSENIRRADHFRLQRVGKYEYCDGGRHGRR